MASNGMGLTPEQIEEARARYLRSIDPENNPDPEAPQPIPIYHPGEEFVPSEKPVHSSDTYTDSVQAPIVDENPYAEAEFADEEVEDPYANAELAGPEGPDEYVDNPYAEAELEPTPVAPEEAPEEAPEPSLADYGRIGMSGLAATGGMVAGLAEYLSEVVGADTLKDIAAQGRRAADSASEYWRSGMSEAGKRDAEKEFAKMGPDAAWKDFDSVMFAIIASAPSTIVTMGPAGLAAKAAWSAKLAGGGTQAAAKMSAAKAAVVTSAASEGALGAGGVASDIANSIEAMSSKELQSLEQYTVLKGKYPGMNEEDIRIGVIANARRWNAAIAGVFTGLVGAAGGPVEARMFTPGGGRIKAGMQGFGLEAVQEGIQSPIETAATNLGLEKPIEENLLESSIAGAVAGGPMGGAMGLAGGGARDDVDAGGLADETDKAVSDTPDADAQQEEDLQADEAESRVADIERSQDAARDEAIAKGGDALDAEMAAAETGDLMAEEDNKIKDHIARMQRRVDAEMVANEEQDKLAAEREKQVLKDEKATKEAVAKTTKAMEEDKAYASKEPSGLGQTGVAGHITEYVTTKQAEAVEKAADSGPSSAMASAFRAAADEAATSPTNDKPAPTKNQLKQGNYPKGHPRLHGMELSVENTKGSVREDVNGEWTQEMQDDYGYVRGTESAEGPYEQLDAFIGEDYESDSISVVDQIDQKTGKFDEHKVMMAYPNAVAARRAYARNYPEGWKVGKITTMKVQEFKDWLKNGDQTVALQPDKVAGGQSAAVASQSKEVIQPKSPSGGQASRTLDQGEAIEADLTTGGQKTARYRLEDETTSKIVDDKGTPVKMYHGQPRPEGKGISRFRGTKNDGVYFSSSAKYASGYAKEFRAEKRDPGFDSFDDTGAVYQTELDIRNPYIIDGGVAGDNAEVRKYQERGFDKAELQAQGYDGVMVKYDDGEIEAMVFDEGQVKSVAGKGKKRIRYRLEGAVDAKALVGEIKQNGDGFTVDNVSGEKKTSGFAVGIGKELIFKGRVAASEEVEAYREEHAAVLASPNHYLGAWMQDGDMYLDVSRVYPQNKSGYQSAIELAGLNKERGIQDLSKSGQEGYISLEHDGDRFFSSRALETAKEESRGNSRTKVIYMSPREFLKMAYPLSQPNEQKAREVEELVKEGTRLHSIPMLNTDTTAQNELQVQGHEGRHRAMELQKQGVTEMPVRLTSSGYGEGGEIRWNYHKGVTPTKLLGEDRKSEMTVPGEKQKGMRYRLEDKKEEEGRDFKNFFSAVTKGLTGLSSTGAEYVPVIGSVARLISKTGSSINKYSMEYIKHRGKFDDHIAFSIPGYKEVQQAVGNALTAVYDSSHTMLDIGASEGSFAKAVTAIGGMKSVSLDPNPDMESSFGTISTVPGATYSMTALGTEAQEGSLAWKEGAVDVNYFDPMGETYDVVHEAMVFQFVSNGRQEQIKRVKQLLNADGLFITEEKFHTKDSEKNEAKKNKDHKSLYFQKEDLDAKSAEVLEGMHKNMVPDFTFERILTENFVHVRQFWDSGNFKGYIASDSLTAVENFLGVSGNLESDFSNVETPRRVSHGGTSTAAFDAWFEGSLVVDEKGEPLLVYHGTNDAGFLTFKAEESVGRGAFFSSNRTVATSYQGTNEDFIPLTAEELFEDSDAQKERGVDIEEGFTAVDDKSGEALDPGEVYATKEEYYENNDTEEGTHVSKVYTLVLDESYVEVDAGTKQDVLDFFDDADQGTGMPGVYETYLSIKDPLIVDFEGRNWDGSAEGVEGVDEDLMESTNSIVTEARAGGYDGVIIHNVVDDGYSGGSFEPGTIYVAFSDNQIKSVYNQGTWGKKEGNILKRLGGTGSGMSSAKAKETLKPITDKLVLLEPTILANPSEAPAEVHAQMKADGALGAKGVFIPETGELYIFSENHQSEEDLVRTLIHEGVAHKGTRYVLGDKFDGVMKDVFDNADQSEIKRIAKRYGMDVNNAKDQVEIAEELVAFIAENGIESTVYQKVLAAIRQALRSLGLVNQWTEADIKGLLRRSRRKMKGKPMSKATIKTEVQIEETGEVVEISQSADVALRRVDKRKKVCEKLRKCVA